MRRWLYFITDLWLHVPCPIFTASRILCFSLDMLRMQQNVLFWKNNSLQLRRALLISQGVCASNKMFPRYTVMFLTAHRSIIFSISKTEKLQNTYFLQSVKPVERQRRPWCYHGPLLSRFLYCLCRNMGYHRCLQHCAPCPDLSHTKLCRYCLCSASSFCVAIFCKHKDENNTITCLCCKSAYL